MSKMSRDKGQRGEGEFFALLSEQLGTCVRRNVDQVRNGGADGVEVPGWAIEVKRWEGSFRAEWWEQAIQQARGDLDGRSPALAYRASRQPWRVRIPLDSIHGNYSDRNWIECDLPTFAYIVRESI